MCLMRSHHVELLLQNSLIIMDEINTLWFPHCFPINVTRQTKKKEDYGECKAEVNNETEVIGSIRSWEG